MMKFRSSALLAALLCLLLRGPFVAAQPTPQDVITVGSGIAPAGTVIDIPVSIRDTSGTPLGIDQPPGSRIQSYSIKVNYAPAASVQSITFTRAGITASKTPLFESSPAAAGTISLLDTFQESTDLLPFVSNAPLPGNQVAHLLIQLSPSATPGPLTLTIDPVLTQLTDEGGNAATKETVANGRLLLVSGLVTVTPSTAVPAIGIAGLVAVALALTALAVVKLIRN
ncbi:MAG TPA: hypothetical protein VJZ76_22650 [Thermoanaerobaculia bacterium]|nr:hypothetical protein [Thermoanaerobaculia bacterium]